MEPQLFATLLTPNASELVADQYRFKGKAAADAHFESGLAKSLRNIRKVQSSGFPLTIY